MDEQTSTAVIQIQIEDINQLLLLERDNEHRQRGEISDWARSLVVQRNELNRCLLVIRDRQMSIMLDQSLRLNGQAISNAIEQERQAEIDHAMACRLGGIAPPPRNPEFAVPISRMTPQGRPQNPQPPFNPSHSHSAQPNQVPPGSRPSARVSGYRGIANTTSTPITQHANRFNDPPSQFGTGLTSSSTGSRPLPIPALPKPPSQRSGALFDAPETPNTTYTPNSQQAHKVARPISRLGTTSTLLRASSHPTQPPAATTSIFDWSARIPVGTVASGMANITQQTARPGSNITWTNPTTSSRDFRTLNASNILPLPNPQNSALLPGINGSKYGTGQKEPTSNSNPSMKPRSEVLSEQKKGDPQLFSTGNNKGTELNQKRARDEKDSDQQGPAKRADNGQKKTIDLTGTYTHLPANQRRDRGDDNETATENIVERVDTGVGRVVSLKQAAIASCVSCGDQIPRQDSAMVECKHEYCRDCLQTVVRNALVDEALYPPRCCRLPFTIDSMRGLLTPEIISDFHEKKIEFATINRTYCSNRQCSVFLYPINIQGDKGKCPICFTTTCTICKGDSHRGNCPKDEGVQQVLALGAELGWKRCKRCSRMIELKVGCNHIT